MSDHYNKDFCYKKFTHWKENNEARVGYKLVCDHLIFTRNRQNIYKAINVFKKEEVSATISYNNALLVNVLHIGAT